MWGSSRAAAALAAVCDCHVSGALVPIGRVINATNRSIAAWWARVAGRNGTATSACGAGRRARGRGAGGRLAAQLTNSPASHERQACGMQSTRATGVVLHLLCASAARPNGGLQVQPQPMAGPGGLGAPHPRGDRWGGGWGGRHEVSAESAPNHHYPTLSYTPPRLLQWPHLKGQGLTWSILRPAAAVFAEGAAVGVAATLLEIWEVGGG